MSLKMTQKHLRDLPVEPLFEGRAIPTVSSTVFRKSYTSLPPIMRISLQSLSSICPINMGKFTRRLRRLLVVDRNTIEVIRTGEYLNYSDPSGFVYGYCLEHHLSAGHFTEENSDTFLFFKKRWEANEHIPIIRIGCATQQKGDVGPNALQHFMSLDGQTLAPQYGQRVIFLFLMYSPIAAGPEGVGLQRSIHRRLKNNGYWLRDSNQKTLTPDTECFEAPLDKAYAIAYEEHRRIWNLYAAQTGN